MISMLIASIRTARLNVIVILVLLKMEDFVMILMNVKLSMLVDFFQTDNLIAKILLVHILARHRVTKATSWKEINALASNL